MDFKQRACPGIPAQESRVVATAQPELLSG